MKRPKCLRDLKNDNGLQGPCSAGQCQWPQCSEHRISCCVPFCRRTTRNEDGKSEWICAEHWRAIPQKKRDVYSRVKRIAKRAGVWTPEAARIWRRMKAIAIQKAAGI